MFLIDARGGVLGEDQLVWVTDAVEECTRTWKVTNTSCARVDHANNGGEQGTIDRRRIFLSEKSGDSMRPGDCCPLNNPPQVRKIQKRLHGRC